MTRQPIRGHPALIWIAVAAILLACAVRVRLLDLPLERDEGEYAYAGQLLLEGVPPYRLAYNMKLPGTYAGYAVVLRLFGQTAAGVHTGLLLIQIATTALVFALARRLFGTPSALAASAAFSLLALNPKMLGLAAHATHFVALPAVGGAVLLHRALESGRSLPLFASGVAFGTAFLMKQPGAAFVPFAFAALAAQGRRDGLATRASILGAGAALPFAATCLALAAAGVFDRFWFWTFAYAREYVSQVPLSQAWRLLVSTFRSIAAPYVGLWLLVPVGLAAAWGVERTRRGARFASGLAAFSFLAVCPGFYFREHYFVLLVPAAAILAGAAVGLGPEVLAARAPGLARLRLPLIAAAVLAAACAAGVWQQRQVLFELSPTQASRAIYGANPFPESLEIARWIRERSGEDARIAVLGSEPQIFFYSRRRSATGYIYVYGLMEEQPFAGRMQEEMIAEIEAARPDFVVLVNVATSWLVRKGSQRGIWSWSTDYLRRDFEPVGVVDILSRDQTRYLWEEEIRGYKPVSNAYLIVYERRKGANPAASSGD